MSINIKNIKKKNKSLNKCIKNKISTTYENKGILLAIIFYITNKYNKLKNKNIKINFSKFQNILKILFSELRFSDKDNNFNININTKEIVDLNIIYINLINKIKANQVYIVPWFDGDNPLIMFSKSDKEQDVKKIKEKIKEWDNCSRTQKHEKFNNYDEFIENIIINDFIKLHNNWSYNDVINFINKSLSNEIIVNKIIKKKIQVPTPYIVPVPMNYPINNTNKNNFKIQEPNIPVLINIQQPNVPVPINNTNKNNFKIQEPNIPQYNLPVPINNTIKNDILNVPQPNSPQANVQKPNVPQANIKKSDIPKSNIKKSDIPEANSPKSNIKKSDIPQANIPQANVLENNIAQFNINNNDNIKKINNMEKMMGYLENFINATNNTINTV